MAIRQWALLSLASASVVAALVGGVAARPSATEAKPAALVNGETISRAEVDALLNARPLQYVKLTEADRLEMQHEALEMLIEDLLLKQFLRKSAPAPSTAEVNRQFNDLVGGVKAQGQSLELYLHETSQTEAQVRAAIVATLQRKAYLDRHLSSEAVRRYYDENRSFFDQETVRASHILLRLTPDMTPAERDAARARLLAVRREIVAGKVDFAEAARRHSECFSGVNGGDVGWCVRRGVLEESFASAAFALKPGEISDLVQTERGLHLIKVIERKSGPPSDFTRIEGKVRAFAGEALLHDLVAQERQTAQVEIKLDASPQASPTARRAPTSRDP
jgi:peptidyl-prolyl cis-trans isomerase C